jgi:hypothetical protein
MSYELLDRSEIIEVFRNWHRPATRRRFLRQVGVTGATSAVALSASQLLAACTAAPTTGGAAAPTTGAAAAPTTGAAAVAPTTAATAAPTTAAAAAPTTASSNVKRGGHATEASNDLNTLLPGSGALLVEWLVQSFMFDPLVAVSPREPAAASRGKPRDVQRRRSDHSFTLKRNVKWTDGQRSRPLMSSFRI